MPSSKHIERAAGIDLPNIRNEMAKVNTFNAKVAVLITKIVGSMYCAYGFAVLALCSLPAILSQFSALANTFPHWMTSASLLALVAWVSSYFLQLVLLSVIMVGQDVQSQSSDARALDTDENTKRLIDLLDIHTEGGLKDLSDQIAALTPRTAPQVSVPSVPVNKATPAKAAVKKATTRKATNK